jgi:hypothetical protein
MLSAMKPTRCGGCKGKIMTDRESRTRAVRILAKSIYRDLQVQGFDEKQIVALATELISEVTNTISKDGRDERKTQAVA